MPLDRGPLNFLAVLYPHRIVVCQSPSGLSHAFYSGVPSVYPLKYNDLIHRRLINGILLQVAIIMWCYMVKIYSDISIDTDTKV